MNPETGVITVIIDVVLRLLASVRLLLTFWRKRQEEGVPVVKIGRN